MIYFDYNATAPLHPAARAAWLEACECFIGNPSSPHRMGNRAEKALDDARQQLADFLGCHPLELVWTSGATESSNLVFNHASQLARPRGEVWISAIEHPATLAPARHYFKKSVRSIPVTSAGVTDLNWVLESLKKKRPALIAVMAANNETGVLQPWQSLAAICREKEIPFFCDAVQWLGKLPANELGQCDFVSGSAHKFGGPKGVGFLKIPAKGKLKPLILGGKQQDGHRAGTENVPGLLAMLAALTERETALHQNQHQIRLTWRNEFESRLTAISPEISIVGLREERLWNTCLAFLPDSGCRFRWVVKLDKAGFAVSTGSACASGQEEPSHALSVMGYSPAQISRAIRFSSGWETSPSEWTQLQVGIASIAENKDIA